MPAVASIVPVGTRFHRLIVVAEAPRSATAPRVRRVHTRCDCGTTCVTILQQLRDGRTRSCGCFARDAARIRAKKHGHASRRTPEYRVWCGLRSRCQPTSKDATNYFARGISVCARWASFENFLDDMGPRPQRGYTIERSNNNLGYAPSNCVWATPSAQARNRRDTKLTVEIARQVRARVAAGASQRSVAKALNISQGRVNMIVHNKAWRE